MKTVLLVDNNRTIVEMLAKHLSEAGYRPLKAYDGLEALELLEGRLPDYIVLDLIMPKIDGYRLARYLKSDPQFRGIPIIILSGVAAEGGDEMFKVEADAFIAKGKLTDTFTHLLTTLRWLEARKPPKREILGLDKVFPREMTRELLLVKQHFDSMLQVMGEGVLEMDEHNRVLFANQAACTLLGRTEIDLFGKPVSTILPGSEALSDYFGRLSGSHKTLQPGVNLTVGDRILNLVATPFYFSESFIGSVAILEDVTIRVRKEQALEELTSTIIETAPIGVAVLGPDQTIMLANDHFKRLASARGDLRGRSIRRLSAFKGKSFSRLITEVSDLVAGQPVRREISFTANRGGEGMKTFSFIASPLHRQNGRPYLLLLVEDISQRAELEQDLIAANRELETANKAKSNFLSIVSHELRTPLSVIRGYLGLILEGKISGATGEAIEALETSSKRARHLQQLIEELLDLSRIESGKITLNEEPLDLAQQIGEVIEMFEADARGRELKLVTDLPPTLPRLVADQDKIRQIFTNLLSNAVKFTPNGGTITLRARDLDSGVTISVSDTGIGIPRDKLRLIFNKFYQIDSSNTRQHGGAGLGLSIVRMILGAMGGNISVESTPGQGSTFTVFLPATRAEGSDAPRDEEPPPKDAPPPSRQGPKTLVLCEDDEDTVKIIRYTFPQPEYELVVCTDSLEALGAVLTRNVDLALLDVRLPNMNGYDLCRMIRAAESTSGIPVVILSAAGQEEEIKRGYEAGADDYIIKPFTPKDLRERIDRRLAAGREDQRV